MLYNYLADGTVTIPVMTKMIQPLKYVRAKNISDTLKNAKLKI